MFLLQRLLPTVGVSEQEIIRKRVLAEKKRCHMYHMLCKITK